MYGIVVSGCAESCRIPSQPGAKLYVPLMCQVIYSEFYICLIKLTHSANTMNTRKYIEMNCLFRLLVQNPVKADKILRE